MTFPNDIHRHPKITRLSLQARWAFVEMNGEARLADNDGLFSVEDALYLWPQEILDELCRSHPTRPLVVFDADAETYLIRDYAEHQQTRAEREELSRKRSSAGRLGGTSRASAKQVLSNEKQSEAEIEIETKREIEKEKINTSPAPAALESLFDDAYSHWPKKVERKKSLDKFKIAARRIDPELLRQHIIRFGDAYAATTDPQFVPALAVWLNGERWNDELPQPRRASGPVSNVERNLAYLEQLRAQEERGHLLEIEGVA